MRAASAARDKDRIAISSSPATPDPSFRIIGVNLA
jgi:hypothetical protein